MAEGSTNGRTGLLFKATSGWTNERVKESFCMQIIRGSRGTGAMISGTKSHSTTTLHRGHTSDFQYG